MATAAVTNTFVNELTSDATDVNQNFTEVVDFLNNQTIHKDGSKAFTGNVDAGSNKIVNLTAGTAATDAAAVSNVTNAFPIGMMVAYGGPTAPSLWLLCDGTAVNRTTYSALFAVIGTSFGAGNGTTTFNLPDMRDKYPIGKSGTVALGASVGSNNAIVVSHNHSIDPPSTTTSQDTHNHTYADTISSGGDVVLGAGVQYWTDTSANTGNDTHDHTVNIAAFDSSTEGSSGTNANRPASVGVNWIIRAGV